MPFVDHFADYLRQGVDADRLSPDLLQYDLAKLAWPRAFVPLDVRGKGNKLIPDRPLLDDGCFFDFLRDLYADGGRTQEAARIVAAVMSWSSSALTWSWRSRGTM